MTVRDYPTERPLTPRQVEVLGRVGRMTLAQAGREIGISRAQVWQIVKRLETLGLVCRDAWGWHKCLGS